MKQPGLFKKEKRKKFFQTIIEKGIKAVFLDEWELAPNEIEMLSSSVDYLWIAPNFDSYNRRYDDQNQLTSLENEFEFLDLSLNLGITLKSSQRLRVLTKVDFVEYSNFSHSALE